MGTSTVTQAREPQKVGEPYNLNRTKKPRNCVKTQMMQRDCAKNQYFSFFIIFWEFQILLGRDKFKFLWLVFHLIVKERSGAGKWAGRCFVCTSYCHILMGTDRTILVNNPYQWHFAFLSSHIWTEISDSEEDLMTEMLLVHNVDSD